MSFEELLPILLGLFWIIVIPIIKSNNRKKALQKPVHHDSDDVEYADDGPQQPEKDIFSELFGLPKQEPQMEYEEIPPEPETRMQEPSLNDFSDFENEELPDEGISAFDYDNFENSPATFSDEQETIYSGIDLNLKENIKQAVIFSEILRRPYAD